MEIKHKKRTDKYLLRQEDVKHVKSKVHERRIMCLNTSWEKKRNINQH